MEKYKFEGKTEEKALNLALYELNVNEKDIIYNVTEESNGLFKGKKYNLEIVKYSDIANDLKEVLTQLLKGMKCEAKIESQIKDKSIKLNIHTDNSSILIGKKGHILDALQTYIKNVVNTEVGQYVQVILDIEGYKERNAHFLERNAKKIAKEVLKTKTDVKLDPMRAYERKVVHDVLTNFKHIETISEGVEPNRCVVIKYKED